MVILDALEVKILREIDDEISVLNIEFDWDVSYYTSELIYLQLIIKKPQELSPFFNINDYISVTFWGNDYFVS